MEAATATPKPLKTPPKISVKIWRPIIDKLDAKLDAACLRRDAYLAKLLTNELDQLDAEVSLANSPAAHDFTFKRLDALDRKLVSIALEPKLSDRMHAICSAKRIVRDAFFNRLFLLLAAAPKTIDKLFFPGESQWRTAVWSEFKHDGPFFESGFYPLEAPVDPFWAIRAGLGLFNEGLGAEDYEVPGTGARVKVQRGPGGEPEPLPSMHTVLFAQKVDDADLLGLNCFVPDWRIPGHEAERRYTKVLDELLGSR
jgi:hypothetical protein